MEKESWFLKTVLKLTYDFSMEFFINQDFFKLNTSLNKYMWLLILKFFLLMWCKRVSSIAYVKPYSNWAYS